jgi:hypothetical protein
MIVLWIALGTVAGVALTLIVVAWLLMKINVWPQ